MSDITATPSTLQSAAGGETYTQVMVEHLKKTRPWVLFMAIMSIVGAGFLVIAGLITLLSGALIGTAATQLEFVDVNPGGIVLLLGSLYLLIPGAYVAPIVFLFRFANSISRLVKSGGTQNLETALRYQKSFWKYIGIFTIVGIGVGIIVIIIAIFMALNALMKTYL